MTERKRARPEVVSALYDFDPLKPSTWDAAKAAYDTCTVDELRLANDMHFVDAELLVAEAQKMLESDPKLRAQIDAIHYAVCKLLPEWRYNGRLPWVHQTTLQDALKVAHPDVAREVARRLRDSGLPGFDDLPGGPDVD